MHQRVAPDISLVRVKHSHLQIAERHDSSGSLGTGFDSQLFLSTLDVKMHGGVGDAANFSGVGVEFTLEPHRKHSTFRGLSGVTAL